MKISDRFTDYGLIGGFFWLLQLGLWCVFKAMTPMDLIHFIDTNFKMLPTSVTSLLGVLGLILVFVTGVVLDLIGSQLLLNIERQVFVDLAQQHAEWLRPFVEKSKTFIGNDFDAMQKVLTLRVSPLLDF